MLYAFGFERVGVVVGDLYFVDPNPREGQEGAEHGVRLELRVFGRGELKGTIYSAQPIEIGQPIWRADLLESLVGRPGSFDRTHHHPRFSGWNPGRRVYVEELSADPLESEGIEHRAPLPGRGHSPACPSLSHGPQSPARAPGRATGPGASRFRPGGITSDVVRWLP